MQAGGSRFESDHLHHFEWCRVGLAYRGEAKAISIDGSYRTAMPEVSPGGGTGLCQGESGSGASLDAAIASLTERIVAFSDGVVCRGDCCVLSESEFAMRGFYLWAALAG